MPELKKDLENIKQKLTEHIKSNYDPEKAEEFLSNINSMSEEEFVFFLKEQGLIKKEDEKQRCIFCSIVFGDVPSTKIGENEKAIAILDLNPASLGHSLIIPKEHIESQEKIPGEAGKLALETKGKLERAFNPKKVEMIASNIMGHEIINILPVYQNESLDSERKKMSQDDLEKIKETIEKKIIEEDPTEEEVIEEKKEKSAEEINEKNTWLPKRLP